MSYEENQDLEPQEPIQEKKRKTQIYCGPTIKDVVQQFSIFRGNIPANLEALSEKIPAIKNLLVDPLELSKTARNIKKLASPENIFFNQILDHLKGEK